MLNRELLILVLTCSLAAASCSRPGAASTDVAPVPIFISDNPRSIYAADPNDSWNRIFGALFTRTVKHRVTDAFPEGAPFTKHYGLGLGPFVLTVSKKTFDRTELGDRAIEPLYTTFLTGEGSGAPLQVLGEPHFSELTAALREAISETHDRSPIERALMQADVWAAYDYLYARTFQTRKAGPDISERRANLLDLLRQFIHKLALSNDEIKALKNNYLFAVSASKLPNPFSTSSGWVEIELLQDRLHDRSSDYRRVARVFVKPRTPRSDPAAFVESLKHNQHVDQIEAVALLVQNLLIDKLGRVVPSALFSDVQFRFFKNDPNTGAISAEPQQFELSRRKLLTEPASGGFVEYSPTSPAYLSSAGNDFNFATRIEEAGAPVMATLRMRCTQCHNAQLTTLMTFSIHDFPPVPTVRILKDHERALYVAQRKEERDDFKSLFRTR